MMAASTATTAVEEVEGSWWTAPVQRKAHFKVKDSGGGGNGYYGYGDGLQGLILLEIN